MLGFSEGEYSLDGNVVGNDEAYKARMGLKSWSRVMERKKTCGEKSGY